jgi:hypothetical protein
VVVGWTDPEGGALLFGYYTPEGKLVYAGRAGTGMPDAEPGGCGSAFIRWPLPRCRSTRPRLGERVRSG